MWVFAIQFFKRLSMFGIIQKRQWGKLVIPGLPSLLLCSLSQIQLTFPGGVWWETRLSNWYLNISAFDATSLVWETGRHFKFFPLPAPHLPHPQLSPLLILLSTLTSAYEDNSNPLSPVQHLSFPIHFHVQHRLLSPKPFMVPASAFTRSYSAALSYQASSRSLEWVE